MTDQVAIQKPEVQDDQAHIDAMVAKADGVAPEAAPEVDPNRPAWLPEKFKTAEDFAKSYAELEAKQSGKPAETPAAPEVKPELNADGTPKVAPDAAAELANKGLDLNDFSTEFAAKGELGADSYEKLEKAGYPKAIVDQYIAGQKAVAAQYEAELKAEAGGADQWDAIATWAADSLDEPAKVAFNAAVNSGDTAKAKLAVAGLTAQYLKAYPDEGSLLGGKSGAPGAGDSYESLAQMQTDMADPQYKKDPAFRKKVQDKLGRSNII